VSDNFITLSNRLLNRCPAVGIVLAQQLVNDAWRTLQSRAEWTWRRRSFNIAPPPLTNSGSVSTNVSTGNPNLITGTGTSWTPSLIGQQIRAGGLLYPYYTIVGWLSPTAILIDQPWAGPDIAGAAYYILGVYYPMPSDWGYVYAVVDIKNAQKLWPYATQDELATWDPQRGTYGQSYAFVFRDYSPQFGGVVGPVIPVTNPFDPAPVSFTSTGFTYVANASYVVQVVTGGPSGTATFQWLRAGQTTFQPVIPTSDQLQTLMDGVQVYWPDGANYVPGDLFVINCTSQVSGSVPRYELWPPPSYPGFLYPVIYIAKEYDLTVAQPTLPPFIANRGEVLLEAALEKCAMLPGADSDHPNPYFNLKLAQFHQAKLSEMLVDLERNDREVGIYNLDYGDWPYYGGPWDDGRWRQTHAPSLIG
jgi:hypothetical protein